MTAAVWVAFINAMAFGAFGYDKWQALRYGARVPERQLILLALLGGWPGAKLGQRLWRHKTAKQPFGSHLNRVPLVWIALAAVLVGVFLTAPA